MYTASILQHKWHRLTPRVLQNNAFSSILGLNLAENSSYQWLPGGAKKQLPLAPRKVTPVQKIDRFFTNKRSTGKQNAHVISPVSQIWALIVFPSTCILLVANSTPIVDLDSKLNSFLVNRESKFDFPTPESPMRTTVKNEPQHQSFKVYNSWGILTESIYTTYYVNTFKKIVVFIILRSHCGKLQLILDK